MHPGLCNSRKTSLQFLLTPTIISYITRTRIQEAAPTKAAGKETPAPAPGATKPGGASLLYVVTFCTQLFGAEAGLAHCRTQMISKVMMMILIVMIMMMIMMILLQCSIDVLNWFEKSPAEDNTSDKVQGGERGVF